jgi:hypothetical protein
MSAVKSLFVQSVSKERVKYVTRKNTERMAAGKLLFSTLGDSIIKFVVSLLS